MPTKKQLGQMREAENEYPGIRRNDDPAKVQPIDHSEGELPVDGLLDEQTRTKDSEDEIWNDIYLKIINWTGHGELLKRELKSKYSITRKQQ